MRTAKPVHYLQYDSRWGGGMFSSHNDPKQTIASSGCGAASSAMVLATFKDKGVTPPDVARVILTNGYRTYNNGVDWGWFPFMAKKYGLAMKQTGSTDEVIKALKDNALVVASMGPGYFTSFGHYILLWGLDGPDKQILVNDPNSTVRVKAGYDLFKRQAAQYFIFYEPKKEEKSVATKDEVTIKAGGKVIKGVLVDESTYAPVRVLAEALGKTVTWDGATKTVIIN
jgi:hypothetical protein